MTNDPRDEIRELDDPNELFRALTDPTVLVAALMRLKQLDERHALRGIEWLLPGDPRHEAIVAALDDPLLAEAADAIYAGFDEMPLEVFLTATHLATDEEFAAFLAWNEAQARPLLQVVVIDDLEETRMTQCQSANAAPDMIAVGMAATLDAGIALLARRPPDIVLLGHSVFSEAELDAVQVVREMAPGVVLICHSHGVHDPDFVEAAYHAGADGVIAYTPRSPEAFVAAVRQFL